MLFLGYWYWFYAKGSDVGFCIPQRRVGTEDGEDELLLKIECNYKPAMTTETYPLAGSSGEFLTVMIRIWLAKALDGLKRGNRSQWRVIGWVKRFSCHTYSIKGLEARRGTTNFQMRYVGRMGEHPRVVGG